MARARVPGWRDQAAADLLVRHLPSAPIRGPVLVMEEFLPEVFEGLEALNLSVARWSRFARL